MAEFFKVRVLMAIQHIAQTRSLLRSAELLGVSQPNLSRMITVAEEELGLRIFDRTCRPLRLTVFGESLLFYIDHVLLRHAELQDFVDNYKETPSGLVRLHAPVGHLHFLAKYVSSYLHVHFPDIKLELLTSNLALNEYVDGSTFSADCDILFTHSLPKDDMLIARRLAPMKMNVYASADVIRHHPVNVMQDYEKYPCILFNHFMHEQGNRWHFFDEKNKCDVHLSVSGKYVCDNALIAIHLAMQGGGYCFLPDIYVQESGSAEVLYRTLPDGVSSTVENYIIYHRRNYLPHRVEVVISVLSDILADVIK